MKKKTEINLRISFKSIGQTLGGFVAALILLFGAQYVLATTPNPGHPWTDIGNGNWQVNNTQTATRTYTFPDNDATVLTNNAQASTTQLSTYTKAYFGATATSTFDSTGALTLATPLGLSSGGAGASLTASNGGIVYSGASSLSVLAGTATAGQVLQSGASAAPSWSTAAYPSTAGTSGNILVSNGTNWVSTTATTSISQLTRTWSTGSGVSASAAQGTSLTIGTTGYFFVPVKITVNQLSFGVTIGGTTPSYTVKVCIYNDTGAMKLIDVTSAALTATGWFNITVSPGVTLYPGNYYVFEGLATQSGTSPTLTFNTWTTASIAGVNGASIPAGKVKYEGTIASRTSGVCPANLFSPGVLTNAASATPVVRLDN